MSLQFKVDFTNDKLKTTNNKLLIPRGVAHFFHVHGRCVGADHVLIGNTAGMLGFFINSAGAGAQSIGAGSAVAAVAAAHQGKNNSGE